MIVHFHSSCRAALGVIAMYGVIGAGVGASDQALVAPDTKMRTEKMPADVPSIGRRARTACADLPMRQADPKASRTATPEDLISLRDFGAAGFDVGAEPGFAVSPGGDRLAVQVRQAAPDQNVYCQALLVFDLLERAKPPVTIPIGQELSRASTTWDGLAAFQLGDALPLTPRWSPDGTWLAFVQRRDGFDGLFLARGTGGTPLPVSNVAGNISAFEWGKDGRSLEFETDEKLQQALGELAQQGRDGYRYDERFWIQSDTKPHPLGTFGGTRYRTEIGTRGTIGATALLTIDPARPNDRGADRAWVTFDDMPKFAYRSRLQVRLNGVTTTCVDEACAYPAAAWLVPGTDNVVFARQEGHARSRSAIYRWRISEGVPQRIFATDDALVGCELTHGHLFCGRERSAYPRDIIRIDVTSGTVKEIVDLNPEWRELASPRIRRLQWTNSFGIPAFGDLVLPAKMPKTGTMPLVVVQYNSRGFLRGGVGDEYPIRPIVDAGIAVLSVSRPLDYNTWLARQGAPFSQSQLAEDWTDRASVHASLVKGLRLAGKYVNIDTNHMAITGLSDGSSAANYALIHSRLFSLALLSTCCEEPDVFTTAIGPAYDTFLKEYEYPVPWELHKDSWRKVSLAMNAEDICAEIQIQAADSEARGALTSFTKLRQAGVPIEMFIFPDEYHVKWQPAHRLAIYRRNIEKLTSWRSAPPLACFKPG